MHTHSTIASLAAILCLHLNIPKTGAQILAVESEVGSSYAVPNLSSFPANNTYGWRFTVGSAPISVTQLGFFDTQLNGLDQSYQVGIWDTAGNLMVQGTIQAGTASSLVGNYRFELVSQTTLSPNTTYAIGAFSPTATDTAIMGLQAQTYANDITYLGSSYSPANAFDAPLTGYGGAHGAFGPNFQYSLAVPEPAEYSMMTGFGLIVLVAFRRRLAKRDE